MKTDVLIIGGGPAGLTAGIYAARARRDVTIIERAIVGGKQALTHKIENYPGTGEGGESGAELGRKMEEQAKEFGVKFLFDNVKQAVLSASSKKVITEFNGEIEAKVVILATGRDPRELGIAKEKEMVGRGVSYCATCDGAFFKDKDIAVIGGGNSALEEALFLTRFAKKVYLVHRRDCFRADKIVQEKVFDNKKIECILNYVVEDIIGDNFVEGLKLKNTLDGSTKVLNISGVFIYIGNLPVSEIFEGTLKDDNGYLITGNNMETNIPGVYAAGDIRQKNLYQVVTAAADGAIAAVQSDLYLEDFDEIKKKVGNSLGKNTC